MFDHSSLAQLRMLADDANGRAHAGDVGRRSRRREDVGAREEMQRAQLLVIRHADAADARQRLRKRADDEVHLSRTPCASAQPRPRRSERAERMRFVDHQIRAVGAGRLRRSRAAAPRRRGSSRGLRRRPAGCADPPGGARASCAGSRASCGGRPPPATPSAASRRRCWRGCRCRSG